MEPSGQQCGFCGDRYTIPPGHDCWLALKFSTQETLEGPKTEYLEIGKLPEDVALPERVRRVDLSNL